jgi:hypothetical protein
MATARIILGAALAALLAGCGEARTALVAPFAGTWHQVAGNAGGSTPDDPRSLGFIAFGADRLIVNLADGEHGVLAISENLSDPGLRAGRLRLEDGSELYLCAGQGYVDLPLEDGRLLAPAAWLDLRWIRHGRASSLRLWSGEALAAADLARRSPARHAAPSAVAAVAPVSPPSASAGETAGDPRDRRFLDSARTADRSIALAARELVTARAGGGDEPELAGIYARMSRASRSELLDLLSAARGGREAAIAEADRLQASLQRFDQAFGEWLPARR